MLLEFERLPSQVEQLTEELITLKKLFEGFIDKQEGQKEVMGVEDVCKLTGYAKSTIYQYVFKKNIPFHKPEHGGRKLVFFRSEIEKWLKGTKPETSEEFCVRKENELYNQYNGGSNQWRA